MAIVTVEFKADLMRPGEKQVSQVKESAGLNPEQQDRLNARLQEIVKNDPLEYRREAVSFGHSGPPQLLSTHELRSIADLQDIFFDMTFTSHRRFVGPVIVRGKRLIFRFLKKWMSLMLARQLELNQRMFNLALTVHALESRVKHLEDLNRKLS